MAVYSQQTTAVTGNTITADVWNDEFSAVATAINSISNAQIAADAAITLTKLGTGALPDTITMESTEVQIDDPGANYPHTGTYDTLDDHISDATAHGGGLAQFERMRYNVLATGTSVVPRWYNKTGQTKTIDKVFIHVGTAPTGASLIVDVNLDGTTIFTTQGNRPTIAASGTSATSGTPDTTSVADGSYIDFDIDQVGSTIPGADLVMLVYFT